MQKPFPSYLVETTIKSQ